MALPADGYISSSSRTTGEFKTGMDDIVTDIARGNPDYVSTRTFEKGAKCKASNDVVYTSLNDGNLNNTPQADDGTNWYASTYDNVLGLWEDLTGSVSIGHGVYHLGALWRVIVDVADVTAEEPNSGNVNYESIVSDTAFKYAVSQLSDGVSADVGYIVVGADVADYTYMIWPDDGRIYSVGSVTGTITAAFDPDDGSDAGLSGDLVNISSQIATAAEITAGSEHKVVTADELALSEYGFDVGFEMVDVTASRSIGGTFTNDGDKARAVSISVQGQNCSCAITVDGVVYANPAINGPSGSSSIVNAVAIVGKGKSYVVTTPGGGSLLAWRES